MDGGLMLASDQIVIPSWAVQSVIIIIITAVMGLVVRALMLQAKSWAHAQFEQIKHEVTPNGGNSNTNGDITKRIEKLLAEKSREDAEFRDQITKETSQLRSDVTLLVDAMIAASLLTEHPSSRMNT